MKFLYDVFISASIGLIIGIGIVYTAKPLPVITAKPGSDSDCAKEELNENYFNDDKAARKFSYSKVIDWVLFIIVAIVIFAGINQYSGGNFLLVIEALFRTETSALKNMWDKVKQ